MATKKQLAVKRAVAKEKKKNKIQMEKSVLVLLLAIIVILLYLLLAQLFAWWPYNRPNLGTAFYTNVSKDINPPTSSSTSTISSGSTGTSTGTSTSGSGTGTNSGGSGTTSTTPSAGTPSIATFSAGVNVGDSKAQVTGQANGLGQNCAVVASANVSGSLGQQQVCTYTQGNKIVTVTYLNDHVVSASKSGF